MYEEGKELNLYNNLTFGDCAFSGNLPWLVSSTNIFGLQLKIVFKIVAWTIWGN